MYARSSHSFSLRLVCRIETWPYNVIAPEPAATGRRFLALGEDFCCFHAGPCAHPRHMLSDVRDWLSGDIAKTKVSKRRVAGAPRFLDSEGGDEEVGSMERLGCTNLEHFLRRPAEGAFSIKTESAPRDKGEETENEAHLRQKPRRHQAQPWERTKSEWVGVIESDTPDLVLRAIELLCEVGGRGVSSLLLPDVRYRSLTELTTFGGAVLRLLHPPQAFNDPPSAGAARNESRQLLALLALSPSAANQGSPVACQFKQQRERSASVAIVVRERQKTSRAAR